MSDTTSQPKDCRAVLQQFGPDALLAAVSNPVPFEHEPEPQPEPQPEHEAAPEPEPEAKPPTLRERAYALQFDPAEEPPADETCMTLGDVPIASRGNLTVIQGKSKVGKSAVVAAVLGAAQRGLVALKGDTLALEWSEDTAGAIIHLDSEQSRADWHALVRRSVTRSGLAAPSPRIVSLPLIQFSRLERLAILESSLEFEHAKRGVDCVVIDGIADICTSPNDEQESLELVSKVMALAQRFGCAVFCVLHENPSAEGGKTRGHLGSELNRKAFANLRIDKDSETLVSTIYGLDMRKRDIPREQGFCFAWNEAVGMHAYQGRAAGLKAAKREADATAKAREDWEPLYAQSKESGTNGTCPQLSPTEAAEILRDISGTKKPISFDAMKKRMQRAESLGVLRKTGANLWALNTQGQAGHFRDKEAVSC